MAIRPLLPLWLLLFVASTAGGAIPGWRFTLGSYEDAYGSILASVLQTSLLVAGCASGAMLSDAGHARRALLVGAAALAGGLALLVVPASGSWPQTVVTEVLTGFGHGVLLVAGITIAALASPHRWRPLAIGALLVATALGVEASSFLWESGVVGIGLVILAVLALAMVGATVAEPEAGASGIQRPWIAVAGAGLVAIGMLAVQVALDPTNADVFFLLTPFRESVDAGGLNRWVALAGGAVALVAGTWLAFERLSSSRPLWPIAAAVGAAALGGAALTGMLWLPAAIANPDSIVVARVAPLAALAGIIAGSWWVSRSGAVRLPAVSGAAAGTAGVAIAVWSLTTADGAPFVPALAALVVAGVGFGVLVATLRAFLADAEPSHLAAAVGLGALMWAAGVGLGNSIGVADATRFLAEEPVLPIGIGVVVVAVLICLWGALASPPRRIRGARA
jgi:hypothetical protein